MTEKIVYLLGAGFSAPFGLPVTSNFLIRAKDVFASDSQRYAYFENVFAQVRNLAVIKHYFEADLFNIEEILSILEMDAQLEGKHLADEFVRMIKDVVAHCTPAIVDYQGTLPGNWHGFILGTQAVQRLYGFFVAQLFRLQLAYNDKSAPGGHLWSSHGSSPEYAVVTLNYDRVLENWADFISNHYGSTGYIGYSVGSKDIDSRVCASVSLVKLHGGVDDSTIVPPTWSKAVHPEILGAWKRAFALLRDATQIRVLGYSLPDSDSYVRYLLKAAAARAPHLKNFDVLCLDPDGSVERRYRDFVRLRYFRFSKRSVEQYLQTNVDLHRVEKLYTPQPLVFDKLEKAHEDFFAD